MATICRQFWELTRSYFCHGLILPEKFELCCDLSPGGKIFTNFKSLELLQFSDSVSIVNIYIFL